MTNLHIEEFLYRGRPTSGTHPDVGREPAYHLIVAETGTDQFGQPFCRNSPPLTPEQAAKLGFTLPKIIAAINADLMNAHADLKARHAALEQKVEEGVNVQIDELNRVKAENDRLLTLLSRMAAESVAADKAAAAKPESFWQRVAAMFRWSQENVS